MTLRDTLIIAAFGAGLALIGGASQVLLQAALKRSEERRALHREWRQRVMDLGVRLLELSRSLYRPTLTGSQEWGTLDNLFEEYLSSETDMELDRIRLGHPDKRVRDAVKSVNGKLMVATTAAWTAVNGLPRARTTEETETGARSLIALEDAVTRMVLLACGHVPDGTNPPIEDRIDALHEGMDIAQSVETYARLTDDEKEALTHRSSAGT